MNLAQELADYTDSIRFGDLTKKVILETKKRVLDSIGCAIGAIEERPVKTAIRVAKEIYPGSAATILGTKMGTTPDFATFANGLMIRYFDFNDTYLSKEPAHPSDNISPCLAVAEMEQRTGEDLILATVLAYEIQCRLCDTADIRHRGWDHVCYGLVSSALASGKLLGLSKGELANAVNISLNSHIAMRQVRAGELSDWKGCSFANAARNAVFSALVARGGLTGPSPIFEGEMGFFKQVSGPFEINVKEFGKGGYKLEGTYIKFYPAEYHSQSAIWAALEARRDVRNVGDIVSVEIETHEAGYTILGKDPEKWSPETKETADHSLPFIVGMALLEGRVTNKTYSGRNLRDPRVLEFLKKITVKEDKELSAMYPHRIANRVTLRLADGSVVTREVNDPKGHPMNPMTSEEIEAKFRSLTRRFLKETQIEKIFDFVWNLERQKDLAPLLENCIVKRK